MIFESSQRMACLHGVTINQYSFSNPALMPVLRRRWRETLNLFLFVCILFCFVFFPQFLHEKSEICFLDDWVIVGNANTEALFLLGELKRMTWAPSTFNYMLIYLFYWLVHKLVSITLL